MAIVISAAVAAAKTAMNTELQTKYGKSPSDYDDAADAICKAIVTAVLQHILTNARDSLNGPIT